MDNRLQKLKQALRENLLRHMEARGFFHKEGRHQGKPNNRKLALKAGVDPKWVGNLLDPENTQWPVLDRLDAVAQALGLAAWQLCMPGVSLSRDANELLQDGIEEDAYQLAAVFQMMPPEARERVRAVLSFVASHPDTPSPEELLRTLRRS